jgi:hypothetical protein
MSDGERGEISRRAALVVIGGTTAAIVVAEPGARAALPPVGGLDPGPGLAMELPGGGPPLSLIVPVIRTQDMLLFQVNGYNVKAVVSKGQTRLVAANPGNPAYLTMVFPSQHNGEQAVPATSEFNYPPPPVGGALAGPSWLAFQLPKGASIPLTIDALLNWGKLIPMPPAAQLSAPDPQHSALEVPWSMWLAVPKGGTWHHSATPVSSGGRTELWHTRLGIGGSEPPVVLPPVRAFNSSSASPWAMSIFPEDRAGIVTLTGTTPAKANFLALTALGASVNIQGHWTVGPNSRISLSEWTHRTSAGRDSYVRVVHQGHLFPTGHRAVYIQVSDREFHTDDAGQTIAYLVQRQYVTVTEPVLNFDGDPNEPNGGRANPMRTIQAKTHTVQVDNFNGQTVFFVQFNGQDVPFSFVATDREERKADYSMPMVWIDATVNDQTTINEIILLYSMVDQSRTTPSLNGALFAFADTHGAAPGTTAQHIDSYTFSASYAVNGGPNYYPVLFSKALLPAARPRPATSVRIAGRPAPAGKAVTVGPPGATIKLPGAEQLTGGPLGSNPVVTVASNYVSNGFQAGLTEIYLAVTQNGPALTFPPGMTGGMAGPNFGLSGIARDLGTLGGDLTDLLKGNFNPSTFFGGLGSGQGGTLLGALSIIDLIESVVAGPAGPDTPGADKPTIGSQAPQITSNLVYPNNDHTKLPTALDTKLNWNPKVKSFLIFQAQANTNLAIKAEINTPIPDPAHPVIKPPTFSVHGELTNFTLQLFGSGDADFINVGFSALTFDAKTGAKPQVTPKITGVTFGNALTFISSLEQLLQSIGGPSITVNSTGINASYSLALPSVGVGVFSLSNLSINGGLTIPFDGTPVRVRFGLCTQENPFLLTIYVFGGGGFFSLALGADGIEEIQVSLEFGAAISIDLGVASGGVSIMAGIYFSLTTQSSTPHEIVQLTGFLKADGNLSVLGIITLSMEFYLGFTYLNPGQAYGEASVTVSISVLFFSTSVTATYKKTIGGGSGAAPVNALGAFSGTVTFGQAISKADWTTYCEAFA